jgi:RHS repeat-associated protein
VLLVVIAGFSSPLAQGAVGRTAGSADVSASGEARYTIPIFAPPGTHGMTPQLALTYGSRGGDALLGVGWSVAGLSAIHRCDKTWAQDGAAVNVLNGTNDRFCRDGNQLKLVAGTYGQPGAEYRTELESFARIVSSGTAGNGPASFTVEQRDGLIYDYGTRDDSKIESKGQTTIRTWALSTIRDRAGNRIEFTYNEDATNGSYQIARVDYTANPGASLSAAYHIEFVYETQPVAEVESAYAGGSVIKDVKRMTRVDVTYNAVLQRRYSLAYETSLSSAGRSRLASITECAGSTGTDCFAPTTFSYQNGTSGLNSESGSSAVLPLVTPITMDVNGDGRLDVVYSSSATSGSGTWMVMFANASGGYASPTSTGVSNINFSGAISIDYDSNGAYDLLVPYSGGTWWVMYGSSAGLSSPSNTAAPATGTGNNALATDVDGDGREDLVWADLYGYGGGDAIRYRLRVAGGAFSATAYTLAGPMAANWIIASGLTAMRAGAGPVTDLNGDGRGDLVYRQTRRIWNEGSRKWVFSYYIQAICSGAWGFTVWTPSAPAQPVVADLNADGRTDIVYYDQSTTINYRFSTGTSFTAAGTAGTMSSGTLVALDWDGDGYEDILEPRISAGKWYLRRSTGEALSLPVDTGVPFSATMWFGFVTATDVNGDGLRDIGYGDVNTGAWSYRLHAGVRADLLTTATDGFGNFATFSYAPLTSANYTKLSSASFPSQDYAGPLQVVTNLQLSNGIGGAYSLQGFNYEGARRDLQGRGFLGFVDRSWIDSRDGTAQRRTYRQDFPHIGAVANARRTQEPSRVAITEDQATYASPLLFGSGFETRLFPYASQTIQQVREVGGAYNGALLRTIVTTNTYDSGTGALYDQTVTTTEPASGANGVRAGQAWTQRTYTPLASLTTDTASWCLGRPGEIQLIRSHTGYGGSSQTRTQQLTWNTTLCRPTTSVLQPGDPQWQVTTALGYDGFGNVNSQTVTGTGMSARTIGVNWGATGQFPVSVTNALSQVTQKGWDYALGVQTSETDPNGVQVSWQYDAFGRKSRENRPDGTYSTVTPYLCTAWAGACNGWSNRIYRIDQRSYDSAGTQIAWALTFHDPFDRMADREVLNRDGNIVNERWIFDALGRLQSQSTPARLGAGESFFYTNFTYDLANRVTQASRPVSDSDPTLQTTTTYYEGLTTRVVDALGKQSTQIADARGQSARSIDHDGYYQGFDFDAFGNPVRVTDSTGATLQTGTYNLRGLRTASMNVDLGSWAYGFNALGEMTSTTDANAKTTTATYDALGRPLTRVMPEGAGSITSTFTWGTSAAAHEIGQLQSQQISGTGISTYGETYSFDGLGRPSQTQYSENGNTYYVNTTYSALTGALDTLTYPTSTSGYRLKLQYEYQYGALLRVKDFNAPSTVFWQANAANARGQVTDATLGNGLRTVKSLDQVTGWVDYVQSGPGGGAAVQNLAYLWDRAGNMVQRQDNNQGLTENAYYDNLYRLDYTTLNGSTNLDMVYTANGNVSWKSGVGTYTYHASKLHAVASINTGGGTLSFSYDANGNMTSRNGTTLTWFASNLPKTIVKDGANSSTFQYTPSGQRWQQAYQTGSVTYTQIYLGSLMEKVTEGANVDFRHTIFAEGQAVALYSRKSSGVNTVSYLLREALGSVDVIADSAGAIIVRESFGAFGQRRGTAWSGAPSSGDLATINDLTRRGYTDHEVLDSTDLIHMNGRVYDPFIARFVSADPLVDGALNTQGWNRYSYVKNNPLSFMDPSGFYSRGVQIRNRINGPEEEGMISSREEIMRERANFNWFITYQFGMGRSDGLPALSGMGGMQLFQTLHMSGFRGANGPLKLASPTAPPPRRGDVSIECVDGTSNCMSGSAPPATSRSRPAGASDLLAQVTGVSALICIFDQCSRQQAWSAAANVAMTVAPVGRIVEGAVAAARAAAPAVQEGTAVFRVFGGEAKGLSQSWTTVNPGNIANFREAAGLFPGNTGQFLAEGRLLSTEGVTLRQALPGPGGVGGTIPELVIPNAGQQVCLLRVCGVNPGF